MSHPMSIDAEKLEEAILFVESIVDMDRGEFGPSDWERARLAAFAAREHLAALPKWKEVEVVQWVPVDQNGDVQGCWDHESQARDSVGLWLEDKLSIVRLTGTAKVRA